MVAITYVSVSWVGSMRILKGFYSLKHSQNQKLFGTKMNTTKRLDEKRNKALLTLLYGYTITVEGLR